MSYEILKAEEVLSIVHVTEEYFGSFKGWRVEFDDGKEALLYNSSDEFIQYDEEWLNRPALAAIGKCINHSIRKKTTGIPDTYFYDMLIN